MVDKMVELLGFMQGMVIIMKIINLLLKHTIQGGLGQGAGLFIDYHNLIGENLIIRNNTGDEGY